MVWAEAMDNWTNVLDVPELAFLVYKTPKLPPPTPKEIAKTQNNKATTQSFIEMGILFFIIGIIVFTIAGGFSSDDKLKELYPSYGSNAIFADANEIRSVILPRIALLISLSLSILFLFFRYRYLKRKSHILALK